MQPLSNEVDLRPKWHDILLRLEKERVVACLLCGDTSPERDARWRKYLALEGGYAIAYCRKCELRWLDPRPSAQGYKIIYSDEHYFGGSGASPEDYQEVVALRRDYFERRLGRIEAWLGRGSGLTVLDYGAATGDFVQIARARGHTCEGIELSSDSRQRALRMHGIQLLSAEQSGAVGEGAFDVLHANHVLEHMPDPLKFLRWCSRVLKPNGLLVAEVPNQFENDLDRLRRFFRVGGQQRQFDSYSLHHTYFFSCSSLEQAANRAGFDVTKLTTFNLDKAPLWPPSLKNWVLGVGLSLADWAHGGGNIIEVYARNIGAPAPP